MKTELFIIISMIAYSGANVLEAWLETTVIALKDPKLKSYTKLNEEEHARSLMFAAAILAALLPLYIATGALWCIPALIVNRRLFFEFSLKKMRHRRMWLYEGSGPVDKLMAKIFRGNALLEFLTLTGVTAVSVLCFVLF